MRLSLRLVYLAFSTGCVGGLPLLPQNAGSEFAADIAGAVATQSSAMFYFPRDAPRRFLPTHTDSAEGNPGQGFIWAVFWTTRTLSDPQGIEARGGVPTIGLAQDTLTAVVAKVQLSPLYSDGQALRLEPEAGLRAQTRDGRVILIISGQDAIRRLWPDGVPDSVAIWWRGPGAQREGRRVAVKRQP